MQMSRTTPQGNDTASQIDLYVSFELAVRKWKLSLSDGRRGPSRYTVDAGDTVAVLECLTETRTRGGGWPHRWLIEQGIDSIVLDAAGIEVNPRARRAETDRLDGDKLPALHDVRPHITIDGRYGAAWWEHHGAPVLPLLRAEIERERAPLKPVEDRIRTLVAARRQEIVDGHQPLVKPLVQLRAIGPKEAWVRVKALFGRREFANRRELAGCVGLAPSPYASGDGEIAQGIRKAGNRRIRAMRGEQAWKWLQLQPGSALTQWCNRRFASGGRRMCRVGIVALVRRVVIARWRYLKHGEIRAGAVLEPVVV
jgi:transposase